MHLLAADALPLIMPPFEARCRLHTKPKALHLVLYKVVACHEYSHIFHIHQAWVSNAVSGDVCQVHAHTMSAPKRDRVLPSAWTIPFRHTASITRVCVTGALPLLKHMLQHPRCIQSCGVYNPVVYTILWCIQSCGVYNPDLSEAAADLIQTLESPCV